jgi:hypothetical protein
MMAALIKRGAELARAAQQAKVIAVAEQLKTLFGEAAVEVEEAQVLVRGQGIIKRWLIDPSLRFLAGGSK